MNRLFAKLSPAILMLGLLPLLMAANKRTDFSDAEIVDYAAGNKSGTVEVKLIPKDATRATVVLKNHSKKPLRIKLPSVFVGVPVLAQGDGFGPPGGFDNRGNQGQQAGSQAIGGGIAGGQGFPGGGRGGQGLFNVAPDGVRKIVVTTVCLEHGKKDPNPRIAYSLRPIESFTKDEQVHSLCRRLGQGRIDQKSAQALSWHLNGLTWQQLASKVKTRHVNGTNEMFFGARNLRVAKQTLTSIEKRVAEQAESTSLASREETRTIEISHPLATVQ